jgi:hypothetical protein
LNPFGQIFGIRTILIKNSRGHQAMSPEFTTRFAEKHSAILQGNETG